jgi:hypothetical protein
MNTGGFILIRNYFTPLPIRQDMTAFESIDTYFFVRELAFWVPIVMSRKNVT